MSNSRTFVPDGVVLRAAGNDADRHWFTPSEVVLAVEVVGEGTETTDRVLKPEVYAETGRWRKFVDTGEPFPINLPISRITPRVR
ncbi:Uma2 family endonuclease [Micromonospora sp. LH3U1]|uniref:Uma2 family endonuclease n=1 Tax=Micromonospora sp. LH3U1 TaxID=3018339 RepID=UPI00234ABA36|nr:Uma2 family endonuclease [Micromonospora sp. LH3U1]WCN80943.1 Uma2 family endonuclease [Micromonospora sp. LH3U1]